MDVFSNVAHGFGVALQPINLLYCFIGVFIGTLVGVLPGIGPISAMSLLLPITLSGTPESGIIMMAGIYYGSMYGGSTTSILVNIPGEAASVVTCIDGHQMAKQGRAGPALGIAALGSFAAGTFSLFGLMLVAPSLASVAIAFGPAEYFGLMVLGLVVLTFLTQGSMAKALLMACVGVVLGLIGLDSITAQPRLTFGRLELLDGIGLVPVVMGLFGVAEVLTNTEQAIKREILDTKIRRLMPTKVDWKASAGPIGRGTLLGFFLGILPGGGAVVASFASYALEKRISTTTERFGNGAIEGVAGPESANNAAAGGAFIPLMTLGIPPNVVMALLLGAFIVHGLQPGPLMITQNPGLFWGIIASMYIGNVMLLVLNLPLIGIWVQLLKLPYNILFPLILLFTIIGVYCTGNNVFDVYVMVGFGVIGYLMRKLRYEPAPLVLAFVLGPMLENNLRKSLILSQGDLLIFVQRPISAVCLVLALALLIGPLLPSLRKKREFVALDEGA
ncbi:tripartite tricarboxylate transporter permease [Bradyrhizobium sp. AUGA SZCCT0240]|uniref:tripartite tricarboxylate transporter permease n=1 Tax=unclassified Bradyrhizobium TaxID=2631580 RepID=UPI001BAD980D|nr:MULTISPECIES: tripartite tricarboxylate transporter permease [unclassified Bradyrhizobium]MBR1194194.1 tripartite tricarboxylate transporter permease [Bradyrhizobium sp. AUGA SZCCT0160]MBR1243492.1 tripartite tricarboxylate transporter permease [Bradyrhizobium sp. AUGA SZCCT0274]MBR1258387.1 tripartite tricarboxylate transporter permease [Bradyrhizobium sp. AUGA SZCCT0240]